MSDPRFYNPDNKPITLTDEIEYIELMRKLTNSKDQIKEAIHNKKEE
jgi:hypothetical protein